MVKISTSDTYVFVHLVRKEYKRLYYENISQFMLLPRSAYHDLLLTLAVNKVRNELRLGE